MRLALWMTSARQLDLEPSRTVVHRRQVILESTFLALLISTAFILRLWGLSKSHFWDETVYLQNAQVICCGKANYSELDSRPPLLSLIYAGMFLLWHNVYAASIAAALLNALGAALLYVSGRMITGRIPAVIASLLLAFSPFFLSVFPTGFVSAGTGNSLLSDSPALTLILLSFLLLLRALNKQTELRFASAGFALAMSVLMRYPSLSSVGVLSLLVLRADRWPRAASAFAAGFAAGIVPYLCWSRFHYKGFFTTFLNGWLKFEGPRESPLFYLKNFGNIFSWITLAGLALWIGRWAWQNWKPKGAPWVSPAERTAGKSLRTLEPFLWLWAAVLLIFFSALRHQEPRYVIPMALPLFLLAGSGLSVLMKGRRTAVRIAGTVLLIGALTYSFLPLRQIFASPFFDDEVSEEMQISDFLNHSVPPTTVLYSNVNYPVFAYYTNLKVSKLPGPGPALYDALNRLPEDGILIAYKESPEITDPRLEWLDSSPHFRRYREFPSVVLYKYSANAGGLSINDTGKTPL